ncbi:MAG TPA: hypothetical protein VMU16_05155 [Candidatus Binataceae bacterium]|nr:hypothetical protein [Candidatus Binataceae bacterium]
MANGLPNQDFRIKIELEGSVDPDTVAHSTSDFINALRDIEEHLTNDKPKVRWRWQDDAAVWAIASPNGVKADVLKKICDEARLGFQRVKESDGKDISWPESFGKPAQRGFRRLVKRLASKESIENPTKEYTGRPEAIRIDISGQLPLLIDHVVLREELGRGQTKTERASIDGVLDLISVRGGTLKFEITEHGTKRKIVCAIEEDSLLKGATKALGKRVVAEGILQLKPDGTPRQLSQITEIWSRPAAVPIADLRGSVPNLTGGLPAADYVRKIRGNKRGDASG